MSGESSLLSRKGREMKKRDALISQRVAVAHEGSEGQREDISAACTSGSWVLLLSASCVIRALTSKRPLCN